MNIKSYIDNYNKKALIPIIVLLFLLFYPYPIVIFGIPIVDVFIKKRLVAVGLLFLILRGMVHDYYLSSWVVLFLLALVVSSSLPFGMIVFLTLGAFIILKALKKI